MSDIFEEFIPDYKYLVVPLNRYSQEDLIEKGDELSAIFILNKLKSSSDFKHLKEVLVITDLKKTKNLDEETKE